MSRVTLFGVLTFDEPLLCQMDVLGKTLPLQIGEASGNISFPSAPSELGRPPDPLRFPLLPPVGASNWNTHSDPIYWGIRFTNHYPKGLPQIRRALLQFKPEESNLEAHSQNININFNHWESKFLDGLDFKSKRRLVDDATFVLDRNARSLHLFVWNEKGRSAQPFEIKSVQVIISKSISEFEGSVSFSDIRDAVALASNETDFPIAYKFQIAAHRAFYTKDHRKSVVETAVAAEIALSQAIDGQLRRDNIRYSSEILKGFRMLNGKIKLARGMDIQMPDRIDENLVAVRNKVVHNDYTPNSRESLAAINATDSILNTCSPLSVGSNSTGSQG